ncbi:hypothetical protein IIB34_05760 [PVC group bacterium]|nr:hypothetical protein [PVC group bacterium]
MLPITLIGSIGIAVALESFPYRWKFGLIVLVVISGLLQVSSGYRLGKKYEHTIEAGQFIQQITQREDLVICTKGLYYTDRKGWNFIPDKNRPVEAMIADVEGFIQKGARYFLVTYLPLLDHVPDFHRYLDRHYTKIPSPKHFIVYNLR